MQEKVLLEATYQHRCEEPCVRLADFTLHPDYRYDRVEKTVYNDIGQWQHNTSSEGLNRNSQLKHLPPLLVNRSVTLLEF